MDVIENLYAAFADVPKPTAIEGCPVGCCISREYRLSLVEGSLRDTDSELLSEYINYGIWTIGNASDFRYFIPKIFELTLNNYDFIHYPPSIMNKLASVGFTDWDVVKKSTIEAAIYEIVSVEIKTKTIDFDGWIYGVCLLGIDPQRFIDLLNHDYAVSSREDFIYYHYPDSWKGMRMEGPEWDNLPAEKTQPVHNWLVSQPAPY